MYLILPLSLNMKFKHLYSISQIQNKVFSSLYLFRQHIISFWRSGRGFFPGGFLPTLPMAVCAACEAIIGLTIEISFIATFTQRYYGK